MRRRLRGWAILALALGWGWQLVALYTPSQSGPSFLTHFAHSDKLGHAAIFALPAAIAVAARLWPRIIVGLLMIQAPLSELIQDQLLAGRHGDIGDVIADLLGIGMGVVIGWMVRQRLRSRRRCRTDSTSPANRGRFPADRKRRGSGHARW